MSVLNFPSPLYMYMYMYMHIIIHAHAIGISDSPLCIHNRLQMHFVNNRQTSLTAGQHCLIYIMSRVSLLSHSTCVHIYLHTCAVLELLPQLKDAVKAQLNAENITAELRTK